MVNRLNGMIIEEPQLVARSTELSGSPNIDSNLLCVSQKLGRLPKAAERLPKAAERLPKAAERLCLLEFLY